MSSIPVVWQVDARSPPEWVLFEMQGELQHKGAGGGALQKKGAATTFSDVATFAGLEMGLLSPHVEHGPTQPEMRIGNLVVPGKLKKLPKPLLVLTTVKTEQAADAHMSDADKKRRRETESSSGGGSATKKPRADSTASSTTSTPSDPDFPTSYLQTVAVIRHKYVFAQRPFSICENQTPAAVKTEKPIKA